MKPMSKDPDTTDPKPYCGLCGQQIVNGEPAGWSPGAQEWYHLACLAPDLVAAFAPENAK
jgi:hypothetical protein